VPILYLVGPRSAEMARIFVFLASDQASYVRGRFTGYGRTDAHLSFHEPRIRSLGWAGVQSDTRRGGW
jgi:hypothetical protein